MTDFIPLTKRDIEDGRMRSFRVTIHPTSDGDTITTDIAAVSAARALRVLAARLENPLWKGPLWSYSPELDTYERKPTE